MYLDFLYFLGFAYGCGARDFWKLGWFLVFILDVDIC